MVQEFTKEEKESIVNSIANSYRKKFIRKIEQDKNRYYSDYETSSEVYDGLSELKTYLDTQNGSEFKTTMKKVFSEVADFLDGDRVEEPMLSFVDNDNSLCVSFKYKFIAPIKSVKHFIDNTNMNNYNSTSNYKKLYKFIDELKPEYIADGYFVNISMPINFCLKTTLLNKNQTNAVVNGLISNNISHFSDREIDRMINRDHRGDIIPMFFLANTIINVGYSGYNIGAVLNSSSEKQDMTFSTFIATLLNKIEEQVCDIRFNLSNTVMGWSDEVYVPELISFKKEEE